LKEIKMSTGFKGPIVHGTRATNEGYAYRTGMGMMSSAEFDIWHDDFHQYVFAATTANVGIINTPWGWQGAAIDTGGTALVTTAAAVGRNGVLALTDATLSEGVAVYSNKTFQLATGKRFFYETRIRTDDVTDNVIRFGLSSLTNLSTTVTVWDTTNDDLLTMGIADGAATTNLYSDTANAGITTTAGDATVLVVNTWHTLAIYYDGATAFAYVDGAQVAKTTTTIPTGIALAAFFGMMNGNGAGGNNLWVDYTRICSER
jgi:hypothetical protein